MVNKMAFVTRFPRRESAQLVLVLLIAWVAKWYYSSASVDQLRWVLAPTTFAVEFITRWRFEFESHAGYMSSDRSFIIAASCAGVNFLITAFLMLSLGRLWKVHRQKSSANRVWKFLPVAAVAAYLTTIAANTVRIAIALWLRHRPLEISWLSPNQIHRVEGVVVYFGFLLLLFVISERLFSEGATKSRGETSVLRRSLFPLLIYYGTTLGVPLINSYRSGSRLADLGEHSAFVFLIPLLVILPLAALHFRKVRGSARAAG